MNLNRISKYFKYNINKIYKFYKINIVNFLFKSINRVQNYYIKNNNFDYYNYVDILEYQPNINLKIRDINLESIDFNGCVKLFNSIKEFCTKHNNKKFIISLSGGVDSMVLITIIHYLKYPIVAGHINYNNRDESILEQKFIENWCKYNNIKLYVKNITNLKRKSIKRSDYESQTKDLRMDFYKYIMEQENADMVLLAHHKDDIVENIFANVCRGRYILDLAVIKQETSIRNIKIGRPIIEFYKDIIYKFAHIYQVPYFLDTTPNWSVRGKYRTKIYPVIEDTFSKNIKENLIYLSEQSDDWNKLIDKEIIQPFMSTIDWSIDKYMSTYNSTIKINIENYKEHPLSFWNLIFMDLFNKFGHNAPSRRAIRNFINIINNEDTNYISLSNNCKCTRKNNIITIQFKNTN
jgi:tRNA(Ile)-lysidine synthetase-like protein